MSDWPEDDRDSFKKIGTAASKAVWESFLDECKNQCPECACEKESCNCNNPNK